MKFKVVYIKTNIVTIEAISLNHACLIAQQTAKKERKTVQAVIPVNNET